LAVKGLEAVDTSLDKIVLREVCAQGKKAGGNSDCYDFFTKGEPQKQQAPTTHGVAAWETPDVLVRLCNILQGHDNRFRYIGHLVSFPFPNS
jgi:hypothetical protein